MNVLLIIYINGLICNLQLATVERQCYFIFIIDCEQSVFSPQIFGASGNVIIGHDI